MTTFRPEMLPWPDSHFHQIPALAGQLTGWLGELTKVEYGPDRSLLTTFWPLLDVDYTTFGLILATFWLIPEIPFEESPAS